jgi:protein-disulfide isomerase
MSDPVEVGAARRTSRSPCALIALAGLMLATATGMATAQTVADVDGDKITSADLEQAAGQALATLEEQAYLIKQQKLEELVGDRLLAHEANRRHVSVDSLVAAEITSKVPPVTSEEMHALYEANRNQLPGTELELKDQLDAYLRTQKAAARRQDFIRSLQSASAVAVYLTAPAPFRAHVDGTGPSRGPAEAPVTIVVFEDFQCPFCKQVHETLEKVLTRYKDRVRLVHRDFPLDALHPAAWKAHEAARCAEQQGKFWEFRNLLYMNAPAAGPDQLSGYASQIGVDVQSFAQCLSSTVFKTAVQTDVAEGNRLGVTGTPSFFVNGRLLAGAQPEAEFARIIDEELGLHATR